MKQLVIILTLIGINIMGAAVASTQAMASDNVTVVTGNISNNITVLALPSVSVSIEGLTSTIADAVEEHANTISAAIGTASTSLLGAIIPIIMLVMLTVVAFWKQYAVLFAGLAGLAMVVGLSIPDMVGATNNATVTSGLVFVGYALVCIAMSYKNMFTSEGTQGKG